MEGYFLAFLEQLLLVHFVLGEDVSGITEDVLVRAFPIHALSLLQEELAVLGAAKGSPDESAVYNVGVYG